ncbi:hypothetical protein ACFQMA_05850 [Halosimplex aquaticum]|uniref:LexA-binding, inner membrane-associated hydrolase n=1 Tax=Halosimplex aquaticum TaxID=3026162 RepID=A0ABD5Y126_9EURY|nr:hypothetical protein [Halosimplex aquaticum]
MPFTPFHLGPALLIGVLCLRWLDLPTFLAASVLVDARTTLVFFGYLDGPLHGPLHTLLGATVLAGVLTAAAAPLRPSLDPVLDWAGLPQSTALGRIAAAALGGCWLHVLLDATLYTDVFPFAPVSTANPLFGAVGPLTVYVGCVAAGLLGVGLYAASRVDLLTLADAGSA